MSLIDWIGDVLPIVHTNAPLLAFLVGIMGGAEVFFLLGFLAAQGFFSVFIVFLFCFLGNILAEIVIFSMGKIKHFAALKKWEVTSKGYKKLGKVLHRIGLGHQFTLLSISKIVYGTGIATILYLSIEKMKTAKFFFYSVVINLVWMPIVMALGWFSGKGFILVEDLIEDIKIAALLIVILVVGIYLLHRWITKRILNNKKRIRPL